MATPERHDRTPENDEELLARLEHINMDENPIERARRLDRFYEEVDALDEMNEQSQVIDASGDKPSERGTPQSP